MMVLSVMHANGPLVRLSGLRLASWLGHFGWHRNPVLWLVPTLTFCVIWVACLAMLHTQDTTYLCNINMCACRACTICA